VTAVGRHRPTVAPGIQTTLNEAADLCDLARDLFVDFGVRTEWEVEPGSPRDLAAQDARRQFGPGGTWDDSLIVQGSFHAQLYLLLAAQHLGGLASLLRTGEAAFPIAPVARSVAEAAARVIWLLDNELPRVRQRCARVLHDLIDSSQRRKTSALAFNHPDAPKIGGEHARLRKQTLPRLFYASEIQVEDNGDLVICNQRLLGPSRMVKEAGRVTGTAAIQASYDYLSSATHPTASAIGEWLTTTQDVSGLVRYDVRIDDAVYPTRVAGNAVADFHRAWRQAIFWFGLDPKENDLLRRAHTAVTTR